MGIKPLTHLAIGVPVPSPLRVSEDLRRGLFTCTGTDLHETKGTIELQKTTAGGAY